MMKKKKSSGFPGFQVLWISLNGDLCGFEREERRARGGLLRYELYQKIPKIILIIK